MLSKAWLIGLGAGAGAAVLAVAAVVVLPGDSGDDAGPPATTASPSASTLLPAEVPPAPLLDRPAVGMTVTLQRAVQGPAYATVGAPTTLLAEVTGVAPIVSVELWAGSTLVDRQEAADGDDPTWVGLMSWTPATEGDVVLLARATDADGRIAASNAVRVGALPGSAPLPVVPWTVSAGETLGSILDQLGAPPGTEEFFGDIDPDAPLPPGTELAVPVPQLGDGPPTPPPPQYPPNPIDPNVLVAPTFTLSDDGCSVEPSNLPPGDDVQIVQLSADLDVFEVVDHPPDPGAPAPFLLGPGPSVLAAEVVRDGIRSMTPPVAVDASLDCGGTWSGDLRIVRGFLLGVPDGIDGVYLYLTQGGAWQRIPAADQAIVPRIGGSFDLRPELPDLSATTSVEIEGWGWGADGPVPLGRSRFTPDPGMSVRKVVGQPGVTSLVLVQDQDGTPTGTTEAWIPDPGVSTFRWRTTVPGVTHGIWQVFAYAPSSGTSPLISGVLAQGEVAGNGGEFEIDLGEIVGAEPSSAQITSQLSPYQQVGGPPAVQLVGQLPAPPPPPGGTSANAGLGMLKATTVGDLAMPPLAQLFVRIVPMVGDHWPGASSNNVTVHLSEQEELIPSGLLEAIGKVTPGEIPYQLDATLVPPVPPNPGYTACWQFVKWRDDLKQPGYEQQYAFWDTFLEDVGYSTPLCPGVCYSFYDQDGVINPEMKGTSWWYAMGGGSCGSSSGLGWALEQLWSSATQLWDSVVAAFDTLKGWVVDAITTLTGCDAIGGAVVDEEDAEAFCDAMATIAVNAALIYFGIPPTLPNSEELMEAAKGEVSELLVETAKDLGIPCDEMDEVASANDDWDGYTCEALADKLVAEVEKQLGEFYTSAAASASGISFPPGAIIRPAPQGQTGPPVVNVTATPTGGAPLTGGTECTALISVGANWFPSFSTVSAADVWKVASAAKSSGQPLVAAYTPNWITGQGVPTMQSLWAVPNTVYGGPVTNLAIEPLPTDDLAFQLAGNQPSASDTYFLSPIPRDPVQAFNVQQGGYSLGSNGQLFSQTYQLSMPTYLPYHALQLHAQAFVIAEIYSPCTGLYRAQVQLPLWFSQTVPFTKVP